jgi:hypothetical protein
MKIKLILTVLLITTLSCEKTTNDPSPIQMKKTNVRG